MECVKNMLNMLKTNNRGFSVETDVGFITSYQLRICSFFTLVVIFCL